MFIYRGKVFCWKRHCENWKKWSFWQSCISKVIRFKFPSYDELGMLFSFGPFFIDFNKHEYAISETQNFFLNFFVYRGIAIEMIDIRSGIPSLPLNCIPDSYAMLQNLPSVLSCRTLAPSAGETVLDMCAAPGNKTTHLAMLMNNKVKSLL